MISEISKSSLRLREGASVVPDSRENKPNKISKTKTYMSEFLMKAVLCLVIFIMIGGLFVIGRIEYDPEEENEKIIKDKKKAA